MQRDSGSPDGDLINSIILEGKIVPGDITINLIKKAMQNNGWNTKKFLIDGFPRSEENRSGWEKIMGEEVDVKFVLFLDCEDDAMIARINARSEASGENKRNDDNMEVLKKRFAVFREQTMPIVNFYSELNKVKTIDANGDMEQTWQAVLAAFEGYL